MTDAQAKQINEMRMRGMGYKAIGMAIGLSRDIVRNYCKRHATSAVVQSNSRRQADRDGSAVKNAEGNGGKHTRKQ